MMDFVLVPKGLPVTDCTVVGTMQVQTDHRLAQAVAAEHVLPRAAWSGHQRVAPDDG